MTLHYNPDDPYRVWTCGNPFSSHTDIDEAMDVVLTLIKGIVDPEDLVAAEGRHCVKGASLLEFTLAGNGPLLAVLYGATWADWEKHAPTEYKPH